MVFEKIFSKEQECYSSFVVVTRSYHRISGSVIPCVFYPCLVSCNCTSFTYCVCLKSCKDKGRSVLRCEVLQRGE